MISKILLHTLPSGHSLVHCCTIFLWDLDWKYSARWEPSIWRCRLLSALQRAEMTDLDQIFCMWYFLCIWRAASENFVHFFYSGPLKKIVLSEVGASPKMLYLQIFWHAITNQTSFFVRWKIWDQEGYNCNIISEMNTNMIKKSCQESSSKVKHYWQHVAIYSSSI